MQKQLCRENLGLAPTAKLILHVSRLSRVKGAVSLTVIESMSDVLKTQPDVQLIIIGEGPMRSEVDDAIAAFNQRYGNKIKIYDFVTNLADWYNATDILVGEGRIAMEALACLKPIVAIRNAHTFIGAIDTHNISYACDVNFDGNDQAVTMENMAKEIDRAFHLELKESQTMAEYIKDRLSLKNMAQAYLAVFKRMS
jgi:glycosyltransferase involved in cell wall biosynthesis